MKYCYLLLFGNCIAGSVLAQHEGHAAAEQPQEQAPAAAHAGHAPAAQPAAAPDPHAGHTMPAPASAANPHAAHDAATPETSDMSMRDQPPPPEAFAGPEHAADLLHDPVQMAQARAGLRDEHGNFTTLFLMADQLELRNHDGEDALAWDAQGWYGGDIDRFWFKSEGEAELGAGPDAIELQALWSHALHPWFDFQAGARLDFESGFERSHLVVGFQGLAPYSFDIDAAAFLSDDGDVSARFEAEYDAWLTQRLILQPRIEFDLAAQEIPERSIGAGLSSGEFGARLHYQLAREFAPYLGVHYERLFGDTADTARFEGRDAGGWSVVLGLRTWF